MTSGQGHDWRAGREGLVRGMGGWGSVLLPLSGQGHLDSTEP